MLFAKALLASLCACGSFAVSFDKEKWASGRGNYSRKNPRTEAEAAGVKLGATRDQVRGQLGQPDSSDTSIDTWHLGRSVYAPDYMTLDVYYDNKAIVTRIGSTQS